jgi:signal transduction histidine kinase/GAF domain-containing protein
VSLYLLLPLVALIVNSVLAVVAVRGGWQAAGRGTFALFLSGMATWGGLLYLMRASTSLEDARLWDELVVVNFAFITTLYLHFTYPLSGRRPPRHLLPAAYGLLAVFVGLSLGGLTISGMQVKPYGYAPIPGPAFLPLLVFTYGAILLGMVNVHRALRHGYSPDLRNRAAYLMAGTVLSLLGTVSDILPVLGVSIYPMGIVSNVGFAVMATLAMVKVRLVDIRLAGRRLLAFTLLMLAVAASYLALGEAVGLFMAGSTPAATAVYSLVFMAALLAVGRRLHLRAERAVDKAFFRHRYASLRALERFSQGLRDISDAHAFSGTLVHLTSRAIGSQQVLLLQPDTPRHALRPTAAVGPDFAMSLPYDEDAGLVARIGAQGRVLTLEEVMRTPEWEGLPVGIQQQMCALDVQLFVPVRQRTSLTGLLLLGARDDGRHYTQEDVDLLQAVALQAATSMENARLYQELQSQLEIGQRRIEAFQAAAGRMTLQANPDQALSDLVHVARELVGAEEGSVQTWDADGRASRTLRSEARSPEGGGHLSIINTTGQTPLTARFSARNGARGVFQMQRKIDGADFTDDDRRLLNLFGVLASVLQDNIQLYSDLSRERNTLAAIQGSMAEGLVVLDQCGRVVYFNTAAERLLSVQGSRAEGMALLDVLAGRALDFEDAGAAMRSITALVEDQPEASQGVEVKVIGPQRFDLALTAFPISLGEDIAMRGVLVRDVTEERDLDRRRDTFVSVASHELRTPMTAIIGFTDMLMDEIDENQVHHRWLRYIADETMRLTRILDDMLDVSRIQSGRVRLTLERLAVDAVASEALEGFSSTSPSHHFAVEVAPDVPKVLADEAKLSQVLVNLVSNAVKYSPKGGVVRVGAALDDARENVIVSVTDEGIGIDPADYEHVFETFHRVRRPETDEIRGTGLGLYIVKNLVEIQGGRIWVEPNPAGQGTLFAFSVPVAGLTLTSGHDWGRREGAA